MSIYYTKKERTVADKSIDDICDAALFIVKDRSNGKLDAICMDTFAMADRHSSRLFTIEEMNKVVIDIVADTFYWDDYKMHQ